MKMLLAYSLLSSALATTIVTGGSCTVSDDHPENNGYHIIGVNGYKAITADKDQDDASTYGAWGQLADDTLWTSNSSKTTYPDAGMSECAKGIRLRYPGTRYERPWPCSNDLEHHNWRTIETCSIMRFSFPASSGSTVFKMASNATFQACDFTGAVELLDGGELPSGATFRDYVFEEDSLDKKYFFASKVGCEEGQKIAIAVDKLYETEYDSAYKAGQETERIQHCDCDHAIATDGMSVEAAHTGFVDGCKSEMPDDLSCCPDADVLPDCGRYGCDYINGGNCMRKSDQPKMIEKARELYKMCNDASNEAKCNKYKTGECPYWRVYIHGGYAYNSLHDGLEDCGCTGANADKPHCKKSVEYGPNSGYLHKYSCSECHDPGYLQYNGRGNRMPDIPANKGCDGANSTYDVMCDWWYMWANCKDLEDDKPLTFPDEAINPHFELEITKEMCDASQWVAAMKMYLKSSDYDVDFPTVAPTDAPTDAPTSAATSAPTEAPEEEEEDISDQSNCRLEAMVALTIGLISILQ